MQQNSTELTSRRPTTLQPTFYRRDLPTETCIALSSPKGKQLFSSAMQRKGLASFFPLMEQHLTQSEPSFCGLTTLVIALNAMSVDPRRTWKGPWRWYEENMLNCCIDLEEVKTTGITLFTFKCLATCQGLDANIVFADESINSFEDSLRQAVIEACIERDSYHSAHECIPDNQDCAEYWNSSQNLETVLIASYNRQVLRQTGTGHFSPIVAFDPDSDSVLIMDTARFKYGAHWVQLKLLAQAMRSIDPDTGRSRGFVILRNCPITISGKQKETPADLPSLILLKSEMKDNNARKRMKLFMEEKRKNSDANMISFCDIALLVTNNGTSPNSVWNLFKPNILPLSSEHEVIDLINNVRRLLKSIMDLDTEVHAFRKMYPEVFGGRGECREGCSHSIKLDREEAIYIIFLACLEKAERDKILFNPVDIDGKTQINASPVRHQLLAEAEQVRCAIDLSDQFDDGKVELPN